MQLLFFSYLQHYWFVHTKVSNTLFNLFVKKNKETLNEIKHD